jgi:hypothetical protein
MAEQSEIKRDWQRLYLARSELNRVTPSAVNSLWQADAGRMLGLLPVEGSFGSEEIDLLKKTGHELFPYLLASAIELGGISSSDLAGFDVSQFAQIAPLVRAVSNAVLHHNFDRSVLEKFSASEHSLVQIKEFQNKSSQYVLGESTIDVSRFIERTQSPLGWKSKFLLESVSIVRIQNVTTWIESDVILVDNCFVADQAGRSDGLGVDFSSDSRIISSNGGKVILSKSQFSQPIRLNRALFLGYPMSSEWGHFYQSVLGRLAYALEIYTDGDLDLILSSNVSQQGRDAILMMNPNLRLHFFDSGTELFVDELLMVPSRGYNPEEISAGNQMDMLRLTTDIDSMRIIREKFALVKGESSPASANIYWSRKSATYRKGYADQVLEYLAGIHGLDIVDLGVLNFAEQCEIVSTATKSFGFRGSYLHNVACLAPLGSQHLVVTNDRPFEWQLLFIALTELLEEEPVVVQGSSRLNLPFYSPGNFHSGTELSADQIEYIAGLMVG